MDGLSKLLGYLVALHIVSVQSKTSDFPQFVSPSRVELSGNRGYRNVLIAIGEAVPEDPMLIEKIKTVFTEFSSFLYQATNIYESGVFFEEIRILVPDSWSDRDDYENPSWETFSVSDIRVDLPDVGPNRNQPSTNKPTQCGAPGMYIHLTPEYITDDNVALLYGDRARTLTHEWGHFRWGVFDEYPLEGDEHFYAASNGDYEATRCVSAITGENRTADGNECVIDSSGRPDENCRFFDDRGLSETYSASLMYKQFLPEMETFCDGVDYTDGIPSSTHNMEAPNRQNRLCAYKSVWQVLREHIDFPNDIPRNTPNNGLPQINIEPSFRLLKRQFQALPTVIVLDMSKSMDRNGRLHTLRQASYNLITRVLEDDQLFGIVTFSTTSSIVRKATTPVGTDRQDSIDALPDAASGGTHIGKAVLSGVKAFQTSPNQDISGSQIILLTDGDENSGVSPALEDLTLPELHGVTVHTIAISGNAAENLEEIANRTNGRRFFQRDNSAALFNIFSRLAIQDSSQIVEILSESFNFTDGTVTRQFSVGNFSTGEMTILVAFPELETTDVVNVEIIKPDGSIIDDMAQSPDSYQFVLDFDLYQIDTQAELGQWIIKVTMDNISSMGRTGTMHVETKRSALSAALPIEASAQWALPDMRPDEIQTLYVTVNQGYTPVADAKVEVEVSLPDNTVAKVPVWDDGKGSDVTAKDGVYSAFFTQFKGDGRYSMQVSVVGITGVTRLMQGSRVGQGPAALDPERVQGTTETTTMDVDTGAFERIIEGESFRCSNSERCRGDKDLYGPYRITDLRGYKGKKNYTAILNFTAPGDDLFYGRASYYEIHISTNLTLLMKELGNTTKLNFVPEEMRTNDTQPPFVIGGNLTNPQPARSIEIFEIQLPSGGGSFSYVFSVVAVDDEGHRSQPSNFASVTAKEQVEVKEIPGTNLTVILGSLLPLLFLLLLLLPLLLLLVRRRRSKKVHDSPEAGKISSGEINPSKIPVRTGMGYSSGNAETNNNGRGHMQSELTKRLQANQTSLAPPIRGTAVISSSDERVSYIHMNGSVTSYDELRMADNMVGGKFHTDHDRTAYNFVSTSPQSSENVSLATNKLQQTQAGNYPFMQVGSKRDELKKADKVYFDPSHLHLQDTYGIDNAGFEGDEHQRQSNGHLSELKPPPSGPPPRPPKQSLPLDGSFVPQRHVDHFPVNEDISIVNRPALPPKIPARDEEDQDSDDSDKYDYEPVADPNSNMQLTMKMMQPERRAPPIPRKENRNHDAVKKSLLPPKPLARSIDKIPVIPPHDSDDDTASYDDPPIGNFTTTNSNDERSIDPPQDIDEHDRPYEYDQPPPSNGRTGKDDEDSDDSYDYEHVEDPNAVLGLASP